jgi:hypothetical protein
LIFPVRYLILRLKALEWEKWISFLSLSLLPPKTSETMDRLLRSKRRGARNPVTLLSWWGWKEREEWNRF